MTNYKEYLKNGSEMDAAKQEKILTKIEINQDLQEKIKAYDKKVELMVFAELFCPDCKATVAILEKVAELNDNINITYYPRTTNLEVLQKLSGAAKIPTVINADTKEVIMIEFTDYVYEQFGRDKLAKAEIVYNSRTGKYNNENIEELIAKILK